MDDMAMIQALSLTPDKVQTMLDTFCRPRYDGKWRITNQLGAYTPCFIDGVMLGVAHLVLIVLSICRYRLLVKSTVRLPRQALEVLLILCASICALVPFTQVALEVYVYTRGDDMLPPYEEVSRCITFLGWCFATVVLWREHKGASKKGWWYLRFGIIFVLAGQLSKLKFTVLFLLDYKGFLLDLFSVLFSLEYLCHIILGIMAVCYYPPSVPSEEQAAADAQAAAEAQYVPLAGEAGCDQVCPEYKSGFLSRMTWGWVSPLMSQGGKKPLHDWDVWHLHRNDTTHECVTRFFKAWEPESKKAKPSLFRALWKCFGGRVIYAGIFHLVTMYTQYVPAMYLGTLLASMAMGNPVAVSYKYAAIIFFGSVIGSVCSNHCTYNMQRVGFRMRSALAAAIFRKGLHLSYAGRQGFSAGRIVGMISGDTAMLQFLIESLHSLWSTPVTLAFGIYLLYQLVGAAAFMSLGVQLLFVPLQMYVASTVPQLAGASMGKSGARTGIMSEMFTHMDTVKCYGWEASFRKQVYGIREEELAWSRAALLVNGLNFFVLEIGPVLVAVAAFAGYVLIGGTFTSPTLFSSIAVFASIKIPMSFYPELLLNSMGAMQSIQRLQDLLAAEETSLAPNPPVEEGKPAIECNHLSFSWDPKAEQPNLRDIHLSVQPGQLVGIVGGTGQGKTSLVNALLGEMPVSAGKGTPVVRGRVAYVPQESWVFHSTLRNNILFGLPFDRVKYERALRVSAMERDMAILPAGDLTEVYERGANLSGGQKQRLSIARAVYADADVYIFDDPLSALDAQVTKQVFDNCIRKTLSGKTRLLVMNQLQYLSFVDHVVLLEGGAIEDQGSFQELMERDQAFRELIASAGAADEEERIELQPERPVDMSASAKWRRALQATKAGKIWKSLGIGGGAAKEEEPPEKPMVQVEEEERSAGNVSAAVYKRYVKAMGGPWAVALVIGTFVVIEVMRISGSLWMSAWAGSDGTHSTYYYISGYALLSLFQVLATLAAVLCLVFSCLWAAKKLHEGMLDSILGAPMAFFQANPLGRLINRFSKDTMATDKMLASIATVFLSSLFMIFSTFGLVGSLNTMSLWPLTPLFLLFCAIYLFFQKTARETERLDALTWNPVFAQWSEALGGLSTLRPYRGHERMQRINGEAMDRNVRYTLLSMATQRWLQLRLDFIGALMILAIAVFIIMDTEGDQASKAPQLGLVLIYAFTITAVLPMVFKFASLAENTFNAVERMLQFADCPREPPALIEGNRPPPNWPKEGAIVFDKCVMRYKPDLPPALKGLTVDVGGGQKVGVVGRTGAGKSTIFNALFRLTELESGRIVIDGCDIAHYGVADVRKGLMIIPQMPVVFTGTIRFNLDPFHEYEDAQLWDILDRAHLKDIVAHLPLGLSTERQLLSLCRALLKRAQILVLDEATAALDRGTDALLQKTVREEFSHCTMLIIAHRLSTIIDSDRILVLDAGQAIEYDSPGNLLDNEHGQFFEMVQSTGAANAKYLKRIAKGEVGMKEVLDKPAALRKKTWKKAVGGVAFGTATKLSLKPVVQDSDLDAAEAGAAKGSSVLEGLEAAALTIQAALNGEQSSEIANELQRTGVPEDKWWISFLGLIDGLSAKSKKMKDRLSQKPIQRMGSQGITWGTMSFKAGHH
eukprot:jgi/Mesen1/919/ME000117S00078